jgi:hypothetical protein
LHSFLTVLSAVVKDPYQFSLFQAMFLTAFHCFLRVGEFTVRDRASTPCIIMLSDIAFPKQANGNASFQQTLWNFRGNTSGTSFTILVPSNPQSRFCPVKALQQYITYRGPCRGPLFCDKHNAPILRSHFSLVLGRVALAAGSGRSHIRPHSFRIGATTTACANGVPEEVIKRLGRWKSDAYKRYIKIPLFHASTSNI